jgi:hypothetical protein
LALRQVFGHGVVLQRKVARLLETIHEYTNCGANLHSYRLRCAGKAKPARQTMAGIAKNKGQKPIIINGWIKPHHT